MKRKVLYLGATPPGMTLGLDQEVRAIRQELRSAQYRFELVPCWVSEASDLVRELRESTPAIVHLGGHACAPSIESEGGLVLHARDGALHILSYSLVKKIFELAGSSRPARLT